MTFQTGSKSGDKQSISVATPLMDNIVEDTESFQIHLTTISSMATVRSDAENATVNIADQSCEPVAILWYINAILYLCVYIFQLSALDLKKVITM